MPNSLLPSSLKNLRTLSASLTKETEADMYAKIVERLARWEQDQEEYSRKAHEFLQEFFESNPYLKYGAHKWRNLSSPTQPYLRHECPNWREVVYYPNENAYDVYDNHTSVKQDYALLARTFPEWMEKPEFARFEFVFQKLRHLEDSHDEEMNTMNTIRYHDARRAYLQKDAAWIADRVLLNEHTMATTPPASLEYWAERVKNPQEAYAECLADYEARKAKHARCKFCEAAEESRAKMEAMEAENRKRQEELDRIEQEVMRPAPAGPARPVVYHVCELCKVQFTAASALEAHQRTKQHVSKEAEEKRKAFWCETCKVQCRTQWEHDAHLQSTKHRKNTGELPSKPTEFHCEPCGYCTHSQFNLNRHLASQAHQSKVGVVSKVE